MEEKSIITLESFDLLLLNHVYLLFKQDEGTHHSIPDV